MAQPLYKKTAFKSVWKPSLGKLTHRHYTTKFKLYAKTRLYKCSTDNMWWLLLTAWIAHYGGFYHKSENGIRKVNGHQVQNASNAIQNGYLKTGLSIYVFY